MKKITVFTPTYNRAYCLGQCYESLIRQTNNNFIWLIIDDGSSDKTKELVEKSRSKFEEVKQNLENKGTMDKVRNVQLKIDDTIDSVVDSVSKQSKNIQTAIWKL